MGFRHKYTGSGRESCTKYAIFRENVKKLRKNLWLFGKNGYICGGFGIESNGPGRFPVKTTHYGIRYQNKLRDESQGPNACWR